MERPLQVLAEGEFKKLSSAHYFLGGRPGPHKLSWLVRTHFLDCPKLVPPLYNPPFVLGGYRTVQVLAALATHIVVSDFRATISEADDGFIGHCRFAQALTLMFIQCLVIALGMG